MISVLHVDDEPAFLELTRAYLEMQGDIIVDGASSSLEAIEMLKHHNYDVIVSDFQMSGFDGLKLLSYVRNRHGKIPFILFTGKGREEVVIQALNQGADFYLHKGGDTKVQFTELAYNIRLAAEKNKKAEALDLAEFSVDQAAIMTLWSDEQGRIIKANKEATRQLGYSTSELQSMTLGDIDPNFDAEAQAFFWNELRRKKKLSQDSMMRKKDGTLAPARFVANYLEINGKKYSFAFGWDISETKRAEQALRESEERYRTLVESLPGLVYRVYLREKERVQFFNDPISITGYAWEELGPDLKYMDLLIESGDCPQVQSNVQDAVRTGKPFEVEYRLRRKDGQLIFVNQRGRPIPGSDGMPLYIDGVIFDVSKRKRDEESVRDSERKFRELADLLPALVFESDANGNISYINETARSMVGLSMEDVAKGLTIYDMISEEDKPKARSYINDLMGGRSCDGTGFVLEHRGNGSFPATIHCALTYKDGTIFGIRGLFVDVSALRQSERMREATNFIAQAAISDTTLEDMYGKIHAILRSLMPLDNFFISLYDEERDELTFPYFKDERDPTPGPRRKGRGITEYVLRITEPLHLDSAGIEELSRSGDIEIMGTPPSDFLGVPLMLRGKIIGIMAAQSYRPERKFSTQQLEILKFVSGQVAMAIERKRQEQELRHYVGLLQSTFESTDDGLLIVDRAGKILAFNERFARMWCIPESILRTMEDQRMLDFVQDQLVQPEAFTRKVKELYEDPSRTSMDLLEFKDRRFFERYSQPFLLQEEIAGRIWSFRDVTERTWAEEALNKSERELKYIINSAKDAIFVKDHMGKYVMANEAMGKLFHILPSEVQGKRDDELFGAEAGQDNARSDQEVLAGSTVEQEALWTIDGVPHTFSVVKVPLKDDAGKVFGICGIARDTTERKQVEKALKDANESLNLLSSITRHDVLNQLMVIRGYSDLVRASLKDQKLLDYMDKVERATRNIRQQIIFTRDFQRLGAVEPRWQSVEDLLDKALTAMEAGKIDISVDLGGLEMYADPMLEKVFYNLLDNTLRHSEKATHISISCHRQGNDLLLVYEDDGMGVAPEEKERIFDRGFGKNTGLGLFLVRLILNVTDIKVREVGEFSKGAYFEILIPDGAYRFVEWDDGLR
jgi:PAS domain S-box-containing protein